MEKYSDWLRITLTLTITHIANECYEANHLKMQLVLNASIGLGLGLYLRVRVRVSHRVIS